MKKIQHSWHSCKQWSWFIDNFLENFEGSLVSLASDKCEMKNNRYHLPVGSIRAGSHKHILNPSDGPVLDFVYRTEKTSFLDVRVRTYVVDAETAERSRNKLQLGQQ